ncbi:MAG TPA: alpha/beta hydrolase-fold protein [Solirubrobacteraceae bacterium]|jgi:enterochelin esterase-like enzyme|nr:alpha/beta hydrolase-fold protein [Solirubrobacteraceae bacterium]
MSGGTHASRTHTWLESLGDWSWPGRSAEAPPLPPAWVPAFPPALAPAGAGPGYPASVAPRRAWATPRKLLLGALLSALAAVCVALALKGPLTLDRILGRAPASHSAVAGASAATVATPAPPPLPVLASVSHDAAGSSIDRASYSSPALGSQGSFLVYLPPGYASTTRHYPVLYLLHGQNGHATAFLEIGIQGRLDRLIARKAIPPMIAVMIQDRSTQENWRDFGSRRSASYVVEVQALVDRMLPTIATRAGRAIAGNSMGGYGAMHIALANPYRFSVVESWLGYFNNLDGELHADRPIISRLGLRAFVYGARGDTVADPAEDPAFAARLRSAGASAQSAVYVGNHSLETLSEHLDEMLLFAGRSLFGAS